MPLFFRVSRDVYINMDNVTEVQLTQRNVTFIHNGGHVKASCTSEDFTAGVKAWLAKNAVDVSVVQQEEMPEPPRAAAPRPGFRSSSAMAAAPQPRQAPPAQAPAPSPAQKPSPAPGEDTDSAAVDFHMNE